MSDRTIQEIIMATIQAEDNGVAVNWKETCLYVVQSAQAEINRLTSEVNTETEDAGE